MRATRSPDQGRHHRRGHVRGADGVIDISIVNVALSDIRASFGTPLDQIAWVSTGYVMANVTVIPHLRLVPAPLRLPALLRRLDPPLHRRERAVRPRLEPALAGRLPRPPGHRRRRHHPHRRRASSSRRYPARSTAWPARSSASARSPARSSARRSAATSSIGRAGTGSSSSTSPSARVAAFMAFRGASRSRGSSADMAPDRRPRHRPARRSAWSRCSTCSRRAIATAGSRADDRLPRGRGGDLARHLRRARARARAPGGRPPRLQEPQLRRRDGAQLPHRAACSSAARSSSRSTAAR